MLRRTDGRNPAVQRRVTGGNCNHRYPIARNTEGCHGLGVGVERRNESERSPTMTRVRTSAVGSLPEDSVQDLDADLRRRVRVALQDLVVRSGGNDGTKPITVDHLEVVKVLFNAWARLHGTTEPAGVLRFGPKPGLWHALQGVFPLTETKRWDALRKAALADLETEGWERLSPSRGSIFLIQLHDER